MAAAPAGLSYALSDLVDGPGEDLLLDVVAAPERAGLALAGMATGPLLLARRRRTPGAAASAATAAR